MIKKLYLTHKRGKTTRNNDKGKIFHADFCCAKVVAKMALVQPISAWPCIRD